MTIFSFFGSRSSVVYRLLSFSMILILILVSLCPGCICPIVNGDFESSLSLDSWATSSKLNENGFIQQTPQTMDGLQLSDGGVALSQIMHSDGGPFTGNDPSLGAGDLKFPYYGKNCAVVNLQGADYNVNLMQQNFTVTTADIDPSDNKFHLRFVYAPVIQNPGHPYVDQPYLFILLTDLTTSQTLSSTFLTTDVMVLNYNDGYGDITTYDNWRVVDLAPNGVTIGDTLELQFLAAGCAYGGHFAYMYVDGVSSVLPGVFLSSSFPSETKNIGSPVNGTLTIHNGAAAGSPPVTNAVVTFSLPTSQAVGFQSVRVHPHDSVKITHSGAHLAAVASDDHTLPMHVDAINVAGTTCTTPAVGATTGDIVCTIAGSIDPGEMLDISIDMTVIYPTGSGQIVFSTYGITVPGSPPVLGPIQTVPLSVTSSPPSVPNNVAYEVLGNSIIVSFDPPTSDGGAPITSYTVYEYPDYTTYTAATSPITVSGLNIGAEYALQMVATNNAGSGSASSLYTLTLELTVPSAPTSVVAAVGDASASVSFRAPASNGGAVIQNYTVTVYPGGATFTGASSPIQVTGLTNEAQYTFTVEATNAVGTGPMSLASPPIAPGPLYDNSANPIGLAYSPSTEYLCDSFSINFTASAVTVSLLLSTVTGAGSADVFILSSSPATGGSTVKPPYFCGVSSSTIAASSLTSTPTLTKIDLSSSPFTVAPNTRYWVCLYARDAPGDVQWYTTTTATATTGIRTQSEYNYREPNRGQSTLQPNSNSPPFVMAVKSY